MIVKRCKTCKHYVGEVAGRYAAGDCQEPKAPRPITTPEATCPLWQERTSLL